MKHGCYTSSRRVQSHRVCFFPAGCVEPYGDKRCIPRKSSDEDTRESFTGFFPCAKPQTPGETRPAPLSTAPSSPTVPGTGTRFPVPFGGTAYSEATTARTTRTRFSVRFAAPFSAGPDGASPAPSMLRGRRGPARGARSEVRQGRREERGRGSSVERGAGGTGVEAATSSSAEWNRAERSGRAGARRAVSAGRGLRTAGAGGSEQGWRRGGGAAAPWGRAAGRRWLLGAPRPPPPPRRRRRR